MPSTVGAFLQEASEFLHEFRQTSLDARDMDVLK